MPDGLNKPTNNAFDAKAFVVDRPWGDGDWIVLGSPDPHQATIVADCSMIDDTQGEELPYTNAEAAAEIARRWNEVATLRRSLEHCRDWYAVRIERITDLAKERGIWPEVASVLANGTTHCAEPPSYAQILNGTRHKVAALRAERDELRISLDAETRRADDNDDTRKKAIIECDDLRESVEIAINAVGKANTEIRELRAAYASLAETQDEQVRELDELRAALLRIESAWVDAMESACADQDHGGCDPDDPCHGCVAYEKGWRTLPDLIGHSRVLAEPDDYTDEERADARAALTNHQEQT